MAHMVKNLPANAGDQGSIPELGRSPGEGNGYPLQYSCLENSMDRGVCWATESKLLLIIRFQGIAMEFGDFCHQGQQLNGREQHRGKSFSLIYVH